jgi:hypothetical protein
VFLIKQIPAWSASQTQRAIGTPKLAFTDTGIACHLLGQDVTRLGLAQDGRVGAPVGGLPESLSVGVGDHAGLGGQGATQVLPVGVVGVAEQDGCGLCGGSRARIWAREA